MNTIYTNNASRQIHNQMKGIIIQMLNQGHFLQKYKSTNITFAAAASRQKEGRSLSARGPDVSFCMSASKSLECSLPTTYAHHNTSGPKTAITALHLVSKVCETLLSF